MTYRTESDITPSDRLDRTPADARDVFARHGITLDADGEQHDDPREKLARVTRNMHRLDAKTFNSDADASKFSEPRDWLASKLRDAWRGSGAR